MTVLWIKSDYFALVIHYRRNLQRHSSSLRKKTGNCDCAKTTNI